MISYRKYGTIVITTQSHTIWETMIWVQQASSESYPSYGKCVQSDQTYTNQSIISRGLMPFLKNQISDSQLIRFILFFNQKFIQIRTINYLISRCGFTICKCWDSTENIESIPLEVQEFWTLCKFLVRKKFTMSVQQPQFLSLFDEQWYPAGK